jgi:hypothetical protein
VALTTQAIIEPALAGLLAIGVLALLWPFRSWLKAHWPHKTAHMVITVAVALGISLIFAGVVAGRSLPDYRNIPAPNDYLVALGSLTLFFATLMTFITSEKVTRRGIILTLVAWAAFGLCLLVMFV